MGEIFMIVPGNTFHKHMSRDLTEAYLLPLHSKSTISTVSTNVPLARHLGSEEDRKVCSYVLCLAFAHLHCFAGITTRIRFKMSKTTVYDYVFCVVFNYPVSLEN